jgi:valyl-tRNA synthetase
MKKTFLLLFALTTSIVYLNAQAYEGTANLDKKTSGSCVSMKVSTDVKTAIKIMENLLKKENLKGGKTKGSAILFSEPTMYAAVSQNYINMFFSFDAISKDKNAPTTTVNMFVSKGADAPFESAGTDATLIANMKAFLDTKFSAEIYNNDVAMRQAEKQKEIEKASKDLDNLQKDVDKRTKDITSYENDIKKAQDNITKANKEIETAKNNIEKAKHDIVNGKQSVENQKKVVEKLQNELKQIK